VSRDRCHQERVAVGRRLRHHVGAEIAAGAGTVLHDELLAKDFADLRADDTSHDVGRTAGGE
jgi:hypothetical protein